jgi:rod shape-determining protein MreC
MAFLDIRQRVGYLLLAVSLGHIVLISAQVNAKTGVPILETVVFGAFAEVQRAAAAVVGVVRGGWSGYVGLRRVKADNDTLRQQLAAAQIEIQQQRALADRSRSLERLLELRDSLSLKTTAAQIIAASAVPQFRTVTIGKGTVQGIRADMPVMAPAGIVGRVVTSTALASKVQLLIDRNAAAGALIERSRSQGLIIGSGEELLRMEYVSEVADVAVGDAVVTSGIDGIYPKGLTIGRIESVEKSGGAYRRITVRAAVDFASLEDVLVILSSGAPPEGPKGQPQ